MEVPRWRQVRWISRVLARWLGDALIAVGILYVWLMYIVTHYRCPGYEHIAGRASVHPPCGFRTALFLALMGISAAAVLVAVAGWAVINRRLSGPRGSR